MAEFNEAVAKGQFGGEFKRKTRDRLLAGKPLCHDDGRVFTATDFFSLFIGAIEPPKQFRVVKPTTDEQAAELAKFCVQDFRTHAKNRMISTRQAWDNLQPLLSEWNQEQIDQFQEVLCELHVWTGEEATELNRTLGGQPAVEALIALGRDKEAS